MRNPFSGNMHDRIEKALFSIRKKAMEYDEADEATKAVLRQKNYDQYYNFVNQQ
jgi:hypothetical protein